METVQQLRDHADAHLFKGEHLQALHAYSVLVQLHPNDLDARLRVADTLLAMGEVQAAAFVYTILARHAANGGYPLRALVALKILEQLEPELGQVTDQIAALYGKGSPKIGRGVRLSLVAEATALPEIRLDTPPPPEELLPAAAKIASDLSRIAAYPETLPPIPIFSEVPPDAFARMLKTLRLVRHQGGQTIIQQGDAGTAFYVLVRGKVAVRREQNGEQQQLAELSDGAIFGEMALVSAKPRSASVVTLDDCDVLEFERESLVALAGEVVTLAAALDGFTRGRLLDNLLSTSPLFRPLERKARIDLVKRF
ncbi:MAG: CRP-like cAMP-binding protein, partial [Polyangiales bacterium]